MRRIGSGRATVRLGKMGKEVRPLSAPTRPESCSFLSFPLSQCLLAIKKKKVRVCALISLYRSSIIRDGTVGDI